MPPVNPYTESPARRDPDSLLTPGEVASLYRVDPKTVTRWVKAGRLSAFKTPGGHHRFFKDYIYKLLKAGEVKADDRDDDGESLVVNG